MKLVGMMDSPYVRRTAISLDALGLPFRHLPVSVFSTYEEFRGINPVVKAPTLVLDDGTVLMDSSLILQYIEMEHFGGHSPLWSADAGRRLRQFRATSLAMAACDKAVQLVYETRLRPPGAQHTPWKQRVLAQMRAAFASLENITTDLPVMAEDRLDQATITSAVVWQFTQSQLAREVPAAEHPRLVALAAHCESLARFGRYSPHGPGVPGLDAA